MKKTLAIVLAVLMAVAALSSFAFVIGSNEVKADFELLRIYAADIDVTQAGIRAYENIEESKDYWTPGKSLCIAVEFRVWGRTLDGHAGAPVNKAYTIAVNSTTADMSFVEYAVMKVASYVEVNKVKTLSYVAALPNGTAAYNKDADAALFTVKVVPQNGTYANVLNSTIAGVVTAKGFAPLAGTTTDLGTIVVPVLNYAVDPSYVDYTVFISAKHKAPNAEGLGDLSASFALSFGDSWVSIYTWRAGRSYPDNTASAGDRTLVAAEATYVTTLLGINPTVAYTLKNANLNRFYRNTTGVTSDAMVSAYLDLSAAGYFITRTDFTYTVGTTVRYLMRYDVFKYTPELLKTDLHYVATYVTENLLRHGDAKAVHLEYNGGIVTFDMTGSFILTTAQDGDMLPQVATMIPLLSPLWAQGQTLSVAVAAERNAIVELTRMNADFGTGIGQGEGYPILNNQFLGAAAAAKFSTPVTNTYLAGTTVAVEAPITDEGNTSEEEEVPEISDEPELPEAGDATIAFVCAAAAILACAALAFVMKKAR